ncbi:ORF6N domain-containing protein [Cronobacter sakazakii]|nr:ORF6N domain-containing protein [Cronobacter sakazakii]
MTTQISAESISLLAHQNIPVITTELLAQLYGTDPVRIRQNHHENKSRFVEGKHFFKVEGEALREFKHRVALNHFVKIARNVRSLILWTERGAARHAKMLETDQAWEVFEKLEDCYFSQRSVPPVCESSQISVRNEQKFILTLSGSSAQLQPIGKDIFIGRVDQILSDLRKSGWIVIKRELLADVLETL